MLMFKYYQLRTQWDIVYFYVLDNVKIMVSFESIWLEQAYYYLQKLKHFNNI